MCHKSLTSKIIYLAIKWKSCNIWWWKRSMFCGQQIIRLNVQSCNSNLVRDTSISEDFHEVSVLRFLGFWFWRTHKRSFCRLINISLIISFGVYHIRRKKYKYHLVTYITRRRDTFLPQPPYFLTKYVLIKII